MAKSAGYTADSARRFIRIAFKASASSARIAVWNGKIVHDIDAPPFKMTVSSPSALHLVSALPLELNGYEAIVNGDLIITGDVERAFESLDNGRVYYFHSSQLGLDRSLLSWRHPDGSADWRLGRAAT